MRMSLKTLLVQGQVFKDWWFLSAYRVVQVCGVFQQSQICSLTRVVSDGVFLVCSVLSLTEAVQWQV